jgi:hypothetical protein
MLVRESANPVNPVHSCLAVAVSSAAARTFGDADSERRRIGNAWRPHMEALRDRFSVIAFELANAAHAVPIESASLINRLLVAHMSEVRSIAAS